MSTRRSFGNYPEKPTTAQVAELPGFARPVITGRVRIMASDPTIPAGRVPPDRAVLIANSFDTGGRL